MLLKGVKVLDLSTLLPGPLCSLFLADLGAEVIKIENLYGDPMRRIEITNKSAYFHALNRNKKSIALNLKINYGKEIFMKLSKNADVIIEGFRPGKVDALGIGYNNIKKINPKIIYCSISGYGQKEPLKNKAGHDLNYISLSGLLDVLHPKPFVPGIQIADVGAAIIAAFSIVAALFYREKTGKGNHIDVPIFNSALSLIGIHIAQRSVAKDLKTLLSGCMSCYNIYKTKDGKYMSLGAIEKKFWQSFCNCLKRDDLLQRQFAKDSDTLKELQILFRSKTMNEWVALNKKYDFCCEPVKKVEEVINDHYLNNKKFLIKLDGVKQVAMPVIFSSANKLNYSKSPKLGEHTSKILSSIGYDKDSIKELRNRGVIL